MRVVLLVVWIVIVIAFLMPLLRRALQARAPRELPRDELVKDPVCHVYVARSRAYRQIDVGGPRYFCSAECARRFAAGA
jgi:YHS domain-containing protein